MSWNGPDGPLGPTGDNSPWGFVCPFCHGHVVGTGNVPRSHGCVSEKAIRLLIREELSKLNTTGGDERLDRVNELRRRGFKPPPPDMTNG